MYKNVCLTNCQVINLTIPKIGKIKNYAFDNCDSITSVTIPNSVTNIGSSAFAYCTNLSSVIIPNSVTSIGYDAFKNCSNLNTVILKPTNTSKISSMFGTNVFDGCSNLTAIYAMHSNAVDAYKSVTNLKTWWGIIKLNPDQ